MGASLLAVAKYIYISNKRQLLVVTGSYLQLLVVTGSHQQLKVVTSSYWQLLEVTGSCQQLLVFTGSYQRLLIVTCSYQYLLVVTRGYWLLLSVTYFPLFFQLGNQASMQPRLCCAKILPVTVIFFQNSSKQVTNVALEAEA